MMLSLSGDPCLLQLRLKIYDPAMGINPHENAINRLVSTRKWSVENSAKWITDEHEQGSYDYILKNIDENKE